MALLEPPQVPNVFQGTPYAVLNGAMWTIAIEFRCYFLALCLGLLGAFGRPWTIAVVTFACMASVVVLPAAFWGTLDANPYAHAWIGGARNSVRLAGIFLGGSLFYLWRQHVRFGVAQSISAALAPCVCLSAPALAEGGLLVFGGYLIFAIGGWKGSPLLMKIDNRNDISDGTYLHAWPVEKLLLWFWSPSLIVAGGITLFVA